MKKGFTLVEILAVIVIIGLLLILIVPPVINRISGSSDEAKETENEFIYNVADMYINEHPEKYPPGRSGKYCILIQDLIDEGKLVEPVTDVVTGENLKDKSVLVTIYSTGTREYEIKEGAECKDISALPMIDFIVEPTGSSWVKQRKVTIIYPTLEGDYQARYRREDQNNNWINDNAYNKGGRHTNIIFNKSRTSTKIEAQLKGNQIITGRVNIVNVDSDAPTITSINNSGKSGNQIKVNITAKDNLSGLDGIYFTSSRITPSANASGWIDFQTNGTASKTYSRNFSIGTYYVYVKDKAGNISAGNKNGIVISNATYHPGYYYCPTGYTSSGSGSSMTCSKTTYTSAQYHSGYYYCPSFSSSTVYASCDNVRHRCGSKSSSYKRINNECIGNWVSVRGRSEWNCDTNTPKCATACQANWSECDDSRYQENNVNCTSNQGVAVHYPTTVCRDVKKALYSPSYYSCPSGYIKYGTGSSTKCRKTTYRDPYYSRPYYDCLLGTLVGGNMCFRSNF